MTEDEGKKKKNEDLISINSDSCPSLPSLSLPLLPSLPSLTSPLFPLSHLSHSTFIITFGFRACHHGAFVPPPFIVAGSAGGGLL